LPFTTASRPQVRNFVYSSDFFSKKFSGRERPGENESSPDDLRKINCY